MESRMSSDVYFVYDRQAWGPFRVRSKFLIDSFCFDGDARETSHTQFKPQKLVGNQFVKLFCRCGSCDFNDDGRFMHEYCCSVCGKYVKVYRRNNNGEETRSEEES